MRAETAINPTTEGNRDDTNKYLSDLEAKNDVLATTISSIKNIQQEMDANLISSAKTTTRREKMTDIMQEGIDKGKDKWVETLRQATNDGRLVSKVVLEESTTNPLTWEDSGAKTEERGIRELININKTKGREQQQPVLIHTKARNVRRHEKGINQSPCPPPPKPPWPPPHKNILMEYIALSVGRIHHEGTHNAQTRASESVLTTRKRLYRYNGEEECIIIVHTRATSRRNVQPWLRFIYGDSSAQKIEQQTTYKLMSAEKDHNVKTYAADNAKGDVNELSAPLHKAKQRIAPYPPRQPPQPVCSRSVQRPRPNKIELLSRKGCQCWPKITRARPLSKLNVNQRRNANRIALKTALASTAGAGIIMAPPSDLEEVVGPML